MSFKNLLKGVVRAAGALVGSQIGGPAGAALGAGLATKLTGGSNKDALLGGLVSGIGAYALPKVGGKLGLSNDGLFGAPAGAGGDMGYINSEAGTQGATRGIANLATSPAGLAALGAGAVALSPADAPPPAPSAPARDNRSLEEMGYDTSPLEREYMAYEGDPYAYGEVGGEQRFFARGGHVRRGIAHFDEGGFVDFFGYDTSGVDASGGPNSAPSIGPSSDAAIGDAGDSGVSSGQGIDPSTGLPVGGSWGINPDSGLPSGGSWGPAPAPATNDGGMIGRGLSAITGRARDAFQNPGRTAANVAVAGIPVVGPINTISSLLGGPTIGGGLMSAIQSATGYGKGSGIPGDADGDNDVTPGDDFANYGNAQYDPGTYADTGMSYMDGLAGKADAGTVAPGTGMASLQPITAPGAAASTDRQRLFPAFDALRYGETVPEARFYAANGGMARGLSRGPSPADMAMAAFERGGKVSGPGTGQSDDIPAMLSDGEYVIDAATVADLGDGSNEAGAKKLDAMRKRIRAQKRRAPTNKIPPKAKGIGHYMGGAV